MEISDMILRRSSVLLVLVLQFAIVHLPAASGQEVGWRQEYNKARQEAAEKGRPLLIDFGTDNCVWCKQLDARTFTDPDVISMLNQRFVPLKIDATRNRELADALRVQSFPT